MNTTLKILLLTNLFIISIGYGQSFYYQDIYKGGITADGFSTTTSFGSGVMNVNIQPGSTIKAAFLFCGRHGHPPDLTIDFNGSSLTYSDYTIISQEFLSPDYALADSFASVHFKDVTSLVNSAQNSYSISIPAQIDPNRRYTDFYFVIFYENSALSPICTSLFINNDTINNNILYQLDSINPIDTAFDVGLSIYGGYMCDTSQEKTMVYINNYFLGSLGGNDYNNISQCAGVVGSFEYFNNALVALGDDSINLSVKASDGLSNINGVDSISKKIILNYYAYALFPGNNTNPVWGNLLSYKTPCDTFSAGISQDTLMDLGDSTHLAAYGGVKYKWQPSAGLICDTCSNTVAKPSNSTLYTCTIYNNDSCSKVLPVKVNIYNNVSVETIPNDLLISLYPNPTENNITLKYSSNNELEFSITSIQGQQLKNGVLNNKETSIDVSSLSPGIYFIVIRGNGFSKSLRFIKK